MIKRLLVLSSSPRRGGNSDLLCEQFMMGSLEAGHKAEKIFLKDKKINIYRTGVWEMGEIKKSRAMNHAFEMGKQV